MIPFFEWPMILCVWSEYFTLLRFFDAIQPERRPQVMFRQQPSSFG